MVAVCLSSVLNACDDFDPPDAADASVDASAPAPSDAGFERPTRARLEDVP
jgi:hypothetical protein